MNHSGDAAEQIVRMGLEGVEVAAKITGTAAKEIALLLLAALKSPEKSTGGMKLMGKERLETMLKSGKPLEIFSLRDSDLKTFAQETKRYGIVYCVLRNSRNTPDGLCDIMVKADDAPKINRLVERFKFATVDRAQIESEIVQEQAQEQRRVTPPRPRPRERTPEEHADSDIYDERTREHAPDEAIDRSDHAEGEPATHDTVDMDTPEINDVDKLLDELLRNEKNRAVPETRRCL